MGGAAVADEEHIRLLKQGVDAWNAWRHDRRASRRIPDLSGANLWGADLSGADLSGPTNSGHWDNAFHEEFFLGGANLSGVDLSCANLSDANLSRANLSGANLSRANLLGTNLSRAFLPGVNLSRASLGVNLSGANMSGADLTDASLFETIFADVDLTTVIGLETCRHHGASTIDHRALQQSGPLPLSFLRGVGLPDKLIDYLPSLLAQAVQHYSCFISYSTTDQGFANRLHADLQNKGVRCWFAPHDLRIGDKTWDAIDAAIKLRDKLLLILSENSINSDWVQDEVQKAFAEERERKQPILFPLRIDDAVRNTPEPWARKLWDQRNIGDFTGWKDHDAYKRSFERVVRDLAIPPGTRADDQ
jgi:uncharacterized protein YjbI with pentapeptide repeats